MVSSNHMIIGRTKWVLVGEPHVLCKPDGAHVYTLNGTQWAAGGGGGKKIPVLPFPCTCRG